MNIVPRAVQKEIEAELDNNKILLITGPRQAGKSTLLGLLADKVRKREGQKQVGGIGSKDTLTAGAMADVNTAASQVFHYNFDRTADLEFFSKQQKVEAFLSIRSLKSRLYIFIDEVQRKKDAGNFFKYFYDAGLNVKFIFSGSSSIELTDSFGDALTGRKRVFYLYPFGFKEILGISAPEDPQLFIDLAEVGEPSVQQKLETILEQSLIWGGYPEVAQKQLENAKLKALSELYESYVQRDVKDLLRVKNVSGFNHMVKLLAHQIGSPLVAEDIVRQTGLHAGTVSSYLDILEGTSILSHTENFNPDFDPKLPKSKFYYFIDNGLRNYALGQLQSGFRTDYQQLAANLVFSELLKLKQAGSGQNIYHYQTYSDNHIDFVLTDGLGGGATGGLNGGNFTPILIRYQDNSTTLGKKVHEFLAAKKPEKLIIITRDLEETLEVKGAQVEFTPLSRFLLGMERN